MSSVQDENVIAIQQRLLDLLSLSHLRDFYSSGYVAQAVKRFLHAGEGFRLKNKINPFLKNIFKKKSFFDVFFSGFLLIRLNNVSNVNLQQIKLCFETILERKKIIPIDNVYVCTLAPNSAHGPLKG
jgi:hypothetical protein